MRTRNCGVVCETQFHVGYRGGALSCEHTTVGSCYDNSAKSFSAKKIKSTANADAGNRCSSSTARVRREAVFTLRTTSYVVFIEHIDLTALFTYRTMS